MELVGRQAGGVLPNLEQCRRVLLSRRGELECNQFFRWDADDGRQRLGVMPAELAELRIDHPTPGALVSQALLGFLKPMC